jgi:hypothetical protein
MKRFTETDKWRDVWFRCLSAKHKCLWQYLCDCCDCVGVIEVDWALASFQIGDQVTELDLAFFDRQIKRMNNGKLVICGFIPFQYGRLSFDCPAHKPVFNTIEKHKSDRVFIGYSKGIHSLQEKETDKETDKEKEKDKDQTRTRAEKLFNRRPTTPWAKNELKAYQENAQVIAATSEDEWKLLEWFYSLPAIEPTYRRRDLATLLNNWPAEISRATAYKQTRGINPRQEKVSTYEDHHVNDTFDILKYPETK